MTELPGPEAKALIDRDLAVSSPSMPRVYPLVPRQAAGCVIEDVDGNRFLDLNAGIAVNATGHSHPHVVAAIEAQARAFLHYCSSDFYPPVYGELCERLAELAPFGGQPARVFLGNSGTEVVEGAIKLARHHTGRQAIIAFLGSFHGRSLGSLSLTARQRYRAQFGPLLPGVYHAPFGEAGLDHIEQVIFKHLALPEGVRRDRRRARAGRGRIRRAARRLPPPRCELCDRQHPPRRRRGAVRRRAHRHDVGDRARRRRADILLSGKGLASGLPLGAIGPGRRDDMAGRIARFDIRRQSGVVCGCAGHARSRGVAAGANAGEMGDRGTLTTVADDQPLLTAVRGRGLMIGLDFPDHATAQAVEQAALLRRAAPDGESLRRTPGDQRRAGRPRPPCSAKPSATPA